MYARFAGVFAALLFAAGAFVSQGTSALAVGYCNPLGPGTGQLGQVDAGSAGGVNVRSVPNGQVYCLAVNGTKVIMTNNTANSPVPGLSGIWRQVYYGYTLQTGWVVNEAVDPIQQVPASAPPAPSASSGPPNFSQYDPSQLVCGVTIQCWQSVDIPGYWAVAAAMVKNLDEPSYRAQLRQMTDAQVLQVYEAHKATFEAHVAKFEQVVAYNYEGRSQPAWVGSFRTILVQAAGVANKWWMAFEELAARGLAYTEEVQPPPFLP